MLNKKQLTSIIIFDLIVEISKRGCYKNILAFNLDWEIEKFLNMN